MQPDPSIEREEGDPELSAGPMEANDGHDEDGLASTSGYQTKALEQSILPDSPSPPKLALVPVGSRIPVARVPVPLTTTIDETAPDSHMDITSTPARVEESDDLKRRSRDGDAIQKRHVEDDEDGHGDCCGAAPDHPQLKKRKVSEANGGCITEASNSTQEENGLNLQRVQQGSTNEHTVITTDFGQLGGAVGGQEYQEARDSAHTEMALDAV